MQFRVLAVLAVALALIGDAACNSAPAATTDFWGPKIEPPRGLGKLAPGMSVADAMKLVPGLHEPKRPGVRDELILDSGVSDVKLTVRVEAGTVSSILAIAKGPGARDLLSRAWGPPEIGREMIRKTRAGLISKRRITYEARRAANRAGPRRAIAITITIAIITVAIGGITAATPSSSSTGATGAGTTAGGIPPGAIIQTAPITNTTGRFMDVMAFCLMRSWPTCNASCKDSATFPTKRMVSLAR